MTAVHSERHIYSSDGTELFLQRWAPEDTAAAELLVLHGYAEHSGRYRLFAHRMAAHGIATVAVDLRGHGRSEGPRGYVEQYEDFHADARAALAQLQPSLPRFLLAHSNGGLVALDWLAVDETSERQFSGLILSNPYLALAFELPAWKRTAAEWAGRLWPRLALPSGIEPELLSHDPTVVEAYRRDAFVFTTASAGFFRESTRAQTRVRGLPGTWDGLDIPLLYIYSDQDQIALPHANRELAKALHAADKTVWEIPNAYHEVLNELDGEALHDDIGAWIGERIAASEPAEGGAGG